VNQELDRMNFVQELVQNVSWQNNGEQIIVFDAILVELRDADNLSLLLLLVVTIVILTCLASVCCASYSHLANDIIGANTSSKLGHK
jgi:hypothetical protein